MKRMSLLLGSVAALVAASSAHAADAVVVPEPETAEYVKICDVYGAGYFYIPGTETCLRIGGYVRFELSGGAPDWPTFDGSNRRNGAPNRDVMTGELQDTWRAFSRLDLQTSTAQETELGTLRTFTETRFDYENGQNYNPTLNFAYIELGGFLIGKTESAFARWGDGYALANGVHDAMINYGNYDTNTIMYSHDFSGGLSVMGALETGAYENTIDSYVPHLVAGVKYQQGWGLIQGVVGYDSNYEEWAAKVRVRIDLLPDKWYARFMATYGHSNNGVGDATRNYFKNWNGDYGLHFGTTYKVNEKASLNTQISWSSAQDFAVFANVNYNLTPNLLIVPELNYYQNFDRHGSGQIGGMLRIERGF